MIDISDELIEGKHLLNTNQFLEAEEIFMQCCAKVPDNSDAWFSLGVTRHRLNKIEAAVLAFERAIHLDPENIAAQNAKANMLSDLGRLDEALEVTVQALKIDPDNPKSLTNQASLLFQGGYFSEALDSLNRVLAQDPNIPDALENRSIVLTRLGRAEESLADAVHLAKFLPQAGTYILQSSALIALSRFGEALIAAETALTKEPENIHAIILLVMAQAGLERYEEVEKGFSLAESLDAIKLGEILALQVFNLPAGMQFEPLLLYLSRAEKRLKVCDWKNRSEYLNALQSYLENVDRISSSDADIMLLKATCFGGVDPVLRLELAKHISMDVTSKQETFEYKFMSKPERLRIGYLAKSFNQDSTVRNTAGIYALHNRCEFEVFCYSIVPGDNSKQNRQIRDDCDQYIELYPRSDEESAQKIHDDCIHILIDLDGISQEYPYKLLAHQVAPIQIGFGGNPFSSGAEFLQYRITDSLVSPTEADDSWTEKLIRLPNTHLVYNQQQAINFNKSNSRKREGLPKKGAVLCCFAEPELIEPGVFECWMKILQRVPGSVLWLLEWDEEIRRNLRNEAYDSGINPSRIIFAEMIEDHEEHIGRYRLADLFLDTFSLNACKAGSDALWAGLPVLSLFGESMATRMTASKLSALEFPTLICSTEEEYLERACYLATHPEYLGILKRKVQRHVLTKPLFNTQLTVLNLEKAYHEIWDRYFRDEAFESFYVEEDE